MINYNRCGSQQVLQQVTCQWTHDQVLLCLCSCHPWQAGLQPLQL